MKPACPHCHSNRSVLREHDYWRCLNCSTFGEPVRAWERVLSWDGREIFGDGGPDDWDDRDSQLALMEAM